MLSETHSYTEKELFNKIAEGEESAFEALFELTAPLLRGTISKLVNSPDIIPDILQEIFLRVWVNRDKLTEINSPRSWLLQITYHYCFDWLRRRKVQEEAHRQLLREQEDIHLRNALSQPSAFAETKKIIADAVNALSPQAKRIYQFSREHGYTISEIAAELGLAPQSVKNTISRAIKEIREQLENKGILLPVLLLLI